MALLRDEMGERREKCFFAPEKKFPQKESRNVSEYSPGSR
jgi:hypothetical protein